MLSVSDPLASARATAACSTRSRVNGMRGARPPAVEALICIILSINP
jgi:hypothetical protein